MLIPLDRVLNQVTKPIRGVIHAGAHLGEEASFYASVGLPTLWIEGNPDLINQLTINVSPYGHLVACALLGASDGEVTFNIANNGQSSSVLQLGTHKERHPEVHYVEEKVLQMRTLDDVAAEWGVIGFNFLNLDLQGYEIEALKGAERVLREVDYIYTEINVDELYLGCARLEELDEFLTDFERVETKMANAVVGWGDSLFRRRGLS